MAACWFLCLAVFSYPLSAERVAHKRILHEADSFLTRGHGAREFEQQKKQTKETSNGTRTEAKDPISLGEDPAQLRQMGKYLQALAGRLEHRHHDYNHGDHDKVGLPKCSDGILQLDGVYEVKKPEEVLVEGPSCRVTGSAELLLWAPVRFKGNLVLAGQLNVKAAGDGGRFYTACVAIEGNFTLHPEARLSIQGCKNQADDEVDEDDAVHGGCLRVDGDAELLGGQLLLHDCAASLGVGGGIYVDGRLQSGNATIDAERCGAEYGGSIHAGKMDVSGGYVTIAKSEASENGGAVYAVNDMIVSGGGVSITESKASRDGGAINAENMLVSGGSVTIRECTALCGGAVDAVMDMNISGGNVSITKSEASRGGAILAQNMMIVSGGNVTITKSEASENGGAIYANNMNVSGGGVTIRESEAQRGGCIYTLYDFTNPGGAVSFEGCKALHEGGDIFSWWQHYERRYL